MMCDGEAEQWEKSWVIEIFRIVEAELFSLKWMFESSKMAAKMKPAIRKLYQNFILFIVGAVVLDLFSKIDLR